jgi:2-polyprenyl-6-methoxyphenol hydroxylase-like FAD-dependent oxidoreductase
MMPLNENRAACFFSPVGPNTALWSVSWRTDTPVSSAKPPVSDDVADWILKEARTRVAHPPKLFNELLEKTDRSSIMVLNARDKRAFAHNSQTLPEDFAGGKVIFIGDANHAVSPFAGNGANMALCDGWELASALLQAPNAAEGVENYDKLVVSQRNRIITQSHIAIAIGHSEGWRLWLSMLFLKFVRLLLFKYVR